MADAMPKMPSGGDGTAWTATQKLCDDQARWDAYSEEVRTAVRTTAWQAFKTMAERDGVTIQGNPEEVTLPNLEGVFYRVNGTVSQP